MQFVSIERGNYGAEIPSVWTPGIIIAAIAVVGIVLLAGEEHRVRRQARAGKRWPPYERKARGRS